ARAFPWTRSSAKTGVAPTAVCRVRTRRSSLLRRTAARSAQRQGRGRAGAGSVDRVSTRRSCASAGTGWPLSRILVVRSGAHSGGTGQAALGYGGADDRGARTTPRDAAPDSIGRSAHGRVSGAAGENDGRRRKT